MRKGVKEGVKVVGETKSPECTHGEGVCRWGGALNFFWWVCAAGVSKIGSREWVFLEK